MSNYDLLSYINENLKNDPSINKYIKIASEE